MYNNKYKTLSNVNVLNTKSKAPRPAFRHAGPYEVGDVSLNCPRIGLRHDRTTLEAYDALFSIHHR